MESINEFGIKFKKLFNINHEAIFFAPGRVNLIGEHVDYNGGFVFPCALSMRIYAVAAKRSDNLIRFYSENFSEIGIIEVEIDNLKNDKNHSWANYPKGVIDVFNKMGHKITHGFDVYYNGNIPYGAGLSSSAAIEVCTANLLNHFFKFNLDGIKISLLAQKAENEFIGMNCGIMDQFASANCKKNHALLLNCNTLEYKHIPLELKDYSIVIINTNKKHELVSSKYNERREQCKLAADILNVRDLCSLSPEEFEKNKNLISDIIVQKRAKHAVCENYRAIEATKFLQNNNLKEFGKLMIDSHNSLKDDYEVSCFELDTIVNLALKQDGVLGARMTGGGFGGCVVSIIKTNDINSLIKNIGAEYKKITNLDADFYITTADNGAEKYEE